MKTLILCVDRDDDLGGKALLETPIVGRRRVLEAATQLGVADPEDSDVNALFAAVSLYDGEQDPARGQDRQVEVAVIAGHRSVGLRSDRVLARQLEEVLEVTRADEVVLVSDGAEDEQILPILTSRVRVAHVHRSIVKQAPRLEGFYHVLTRMLDDDKLAKRYVLPLGLIFMVWAVALIFHMIYEAAGVTLGIAGVWLIVHAMHWEERLTGFFREFWEGLRTGKVTWVADAVMLILIVIGIVQGYQRTELGAERAVVALTFLDAFYLWLIGALLVRTGGLLVDDWIRQGTTGLGRWSAVFTLISLGFIGSAGLELAVDIVEGSRLTTTLITFDLLLRLLAGFFVAVGGILVMKHLRTLMDRPAPARVR